MTERRHTHDLPRRRRARQRLPGGRTRQRRNAAVRTSTSPPARGAHATSSRCGTPSQRWVGFATRPCRRRRATGSSPPSGTGSDRDASFGARAGGRRRRRAPRRAARGHAASASAAGHPGSPPTSLSPAAPGRRRGRACHGPASSAGRPAGAPASVQTTRPTPLSPRRRSRRAGPPAIRSDSHRTPALLLQLDHRVEPATDRLPAVERADRRQHLLRVLLHHRAQQRGAVLEVVIELALARARARDHLVEARLGDPLREDELARRNDDPLARRASLRRLRRLQHSPILCRYGRTGPIRRAFPEVRNAVARRPPYPAPGRARGVLPRRNRAAGDRRLPRPSGLRRRLPCHPGHRGPPRVHGRRRPRRAGAEPRVACSCSTSETTRRSTRSQHA